MTRPSLAAFFDPRCVAVIGASRDPSKVGGSVLANLGSAGFPGWVIPVNARADSVQGLRAYPSLLDADGEVDLAVITVPAPGVLAALEQCVTKGVPGAIVISAGFRESAEDGQKREADLRRWLVGQPIRVLGPNCLGWIRLAPLLRGVRGEAPVDRTAVAETICRFARLVVDVPGLRDIEINPLVAGPAGAVAVDARGALER